MKESFLWVEYVQQTDYSISQKRMMIHSRTGLIWFSNSTQIEFNDPVTVINSSLEVNNDFFFVYETTVSYDL